MNKTHKAPGVGEGIISPVLARDDWDRLFWITNNTFSESFGLVCHVECAKKDREIVDFRMAYLTLDRKAPQIANAVIEITV